jgi:hypothetical protein
MHSNYIPLGVAGKVPCAALTLSLQGFYRSSFWLTLHRLNIPFNNFLPRFVLKAVMSSKRPPAHWRDASQGRQGRSQIMKKSLALMTLIAGMTVGICLARGGATQTNYSGTWTLDLNKTHDLPSQLQSYTMEVTQTDRKLTVKTTVQGDLTPSVGPEGGEQSGGGFPSGRRRGGGYPEGGGFPGGGGGYPGGGVGFPGGGGFPRGGRGGGGYPGGGPGGTGQSGGRGERGGQFRAFAMVLPSATYNLDGTQSVVEVDKPIPGSATLKAAWKKGGKQLDLFAEESLRGGDRSLKAKEEWELSKDGKVLQVRRIVNTPRGSTTVKLIFNKAGGPQGNT